MGEAHSLILFVIAGEWTRAKSRGPMTGSAKQSRNIPYWIALSLRSSQ
jgi:hypothetical protein